MIITQTYASSKAKCHNLGTAGFNKQFLPGNIIPHEWYKRFCSGDGSADFVAIIVLADVVAWNRNGTSDYYGENAPKFDGKSLSVPYNYFEEKFGLHPQRTRRAFVRLEELSVLKRKVCNIQLEDGSRINRISITLKNSFFKSCFRDPDTDLRVTNNDNIGGGMGLNVNSKAFQNGIIESSSDYDCRDQISNKTFFDKNRSTESNFCKNYFEKNFDQENNFQESNVDNSDKIKNIFSKSKELKDFYPLSDEDCRVLQISSRREFSLNAMNEILLDMSKKVKKAVFYSKKGFMSYMSKAFAWEKRSEINANNEGFKIRNNLSKCEIEAQEKEKFLTEIEYNLQVSPEWHLKKKLACVFDTDKSYELLRAYRNVRREGSVFILNLDKYINLTELDREIILSQVKASHENIDFESNDLGMIEKLEIKMPDKLCNDSLKIGGSANEITKIPDNIWGRARRRLIGLYGEATDRNWFSKLDAIVDEESKTIKLKAPSNFFRDWINQNYHSLIERVIPGDFRLAEVVV